MHLTHNEELPLVFPSINDGKMEILEKLSFLKVNAKYEWPDFAAFGNDFNHCIKLRRALVTDVFDALVQCGSARIGEDPGSPEERHMALIRIARVSSESG